MVMCYDPTYPPTKSPAKSVRFKKSAGRFWKRVPKDVEIAHGNDPEHFYSCIITDTKTGKRVMVSALEGDDFISTAKALGL
jgi:hypothetical protein